jgi:hypothetical protein
MRKLIILAALAAACGGAKKNVAKPDDKATQPVAHQNDDSNDGDGDDNMQVEGTVGHIDPDAAENVIQARADQMSGCWSQEAASHRYVGGHVELAMHVDRDGSVKVAKIADGDLGSWTIEKCLIASAKELTFPKPKGGPEADVSFPLDFPTQSKIVRDMDQKRAGAELAKKMNELDKCVEKQPKTVQVTVYIGPGGAVQSAGFATSDDGGLDEAWGDCALEKAMAWKVTDPRGVIWKGSMSYSGHK